MTWTLEEAISYYQKLGAPQDQTALISLLREIQQENGGSIPRFSIVTVARSYSIKENLILAIIKRIPSLRLNDTHCLEICAGPNCGKHTQLANYAEQLQKASRNAFSVKFSPCMRMCRKGPNVKWDGQIFHRCDITSLKKLLEDAGIDFPAGLDSASFVG